MSIRHTFVVAVLALAAACQSGPRPLSEADKEAIRSLESSFAKLAVLGSFTTLTELYYTDDALLLAPNAPPASGRANIDAALRTFPRITAFKITPHEIVGEGDLAYSYGSYTLTMEVPGAPAITDEGKSLVVYWRQKGGAWKARRDMFNSSLPAPAGKQ